MDRQRKPEFRVLSQLSCEDRKLINKGFSVPSGQRYESIIPWYERLNSSRLLLAQIMHISKLETTRSRASSSVLARSSFAGTFAAMFVCLQWVQFLPSVSRQNWCSRSKNQFDDSKPEWLAQELGLRWLQRMKQICAEPLFCLLSAHKRVSKRGSARRVRKRLLRRPFNCAIMSVIVI